MQLNQGNFFHSIPSEETGVAIGISFAERHPESDSDANCVLVRVGGDFDNLARVAYLDVGHLDSLIHALNEARRIYYGKW